MLQSICKAGFGSGIYLTYVISCTLHVRYRYLSLTQSGLSLTEEPLLSLHGPLGTFCLLCQLIGLDDEGEAKLGNRYMM